MWFGAGRDVDDLVVVTLRGGVGAGVAVGGTLYRGATNSAGEWGTPASSSTGGTAAAGSGAASRRTSARPASPERSVNCVRRAPCRASATRRRRSTPWPRAAAEGDPAAVEAVERTARYLGVAVANLLNLLNPQALVIGGPTAERLGERLLSRTRRVAADHALPQSLRAAEPRLSAVPDNPVTLGAATFALEGFLDDRETFGPVKAGRRAARSRAAS